MSESSLFKRLFISIAGLLLLLFCLASLLVYYSISEHLNRDKDAELVNSSHVLWDVIRSEVKGEKDNSGDSLPRALQQQMRQSLSRYSQWQTFRIWKNNVLLFQSDEGALEGTPAARPDFSEKKLGEEKWRTYAFYVQEKDIIVEVSENLLNRKLLIQGIFEGFLASSVLLLPLLGLLLFLCVKYGLRGLTHMEQRLIERGPQSLEHINIETLPKELKPLQKAINFLLGKLKDVLAQEKQLIDNAAHELRTPLATLKLHAQLAAGAANEKDRAESMQDLFSTIASTTVLVDQLLALSRIAAQQVVKNPVSLYHVAEKTLRAHEANRKIHVRVEGDRQASVASHEELLGVLLGVLTDNAVKYTPEGGTIIVTISEECIEVSDTGPGIPLEERQKVLERFYRGRHTTPGNGLGLAIAKQICDLLGITLSLLDGPGNRGLTVRLSFS